MDFDFKKVSKALAGAAAAVFASLLVKWGVNLPPEFSAAVELILDSVITGAIGYVVVYFAPKNKV